MSPVCEPTREAALSAARRLDARVPEAQIGPTSLSLAVVYLRIDPQTGKLQEMGVRALHRKYAASRHFSVIFHGYHEAHDLAGRPL